MRSATVSVARQALFSSYKRSTTVCVAPRLFTQPVRTNATTATATATTTTTVETAVPKITKPKKESLTKPLIPQQIENYPFPDAKDVAKRITSGEFKGKLHIFALDFETTGTSIKTLPRIAEISIEHIPEGKLAALQAQPVKDAATNVAPQSSSTMASPTATDSQFYSLVDAEVASVFYAWKHHKIDKGFYKGKPSMADTFNSIVNWLNKFSSSKEDLFVFLMPHVATMDKVTLSNEISRFNFHAPTNWVFVSATPILQKKLQLGKKLENIYSHLYGSAPQRIFRADADSKIVKECLAKAFTSTQELKDAIIEEMGRTEEFLVPEEKKK